MRPTDDPPVFLDIMHEEIYPSVQVRLLDPKDNRFHDGGYYAPNSLEGWEVVSPTAKLQFGALAVSGEDLGRVVRAGETGEDAAGAVCGEMGTLQFWCVCGRGIRYYA